ncbi:ankyrin repeat domain-containing protein [Legionella israelensis]|uniref:ankyrin repeat domain-containing protein n=1 Tax=Legionella israelensis TaxID=454 RepID=UPI00117E0726|nr:ankyrin repeat domain-containing protein [Legionella israelensis]QDP72924.1 ankyrin repeat domain-containing protein [Legionella israelensis]
MREDLKKAVLNNDIDALKNIEGLLDELNNMDDSNHSLLHYAVIKGDLKLVKYLLAKGIDIELKNNDGDTALHLAVKKGYYELVYEMLGISTAAKDRVQNKKTWKDKDRTEKLENLKKSQTKAHTLLNEENNAQETPLILAAKLKNDAIYNALLKLKPGYQKKHLDQALSIRKNHVSRLKRKSFVGALLESFCPSASVAEISESFAYTGLTAGASAAVALGFNIAFAGVALIGFGIIAYANYKKNQAEKKAREELENLQIELAYIRNIEIRHKQLSKKKELSREDKDELQVMLTELNNPTQYQKAKGAETSSADYITKKEKMYTALSSMGSFLCAYAGILGVTGLGLEIAAGVMGIGMGALIVSAGPFAIAAVLAVGLVIAAGLAVHHYRKRKQDYLAFGEMHQSMNKQKENIYREKQNLLNKGVKENIQSLCEDKKPAPSEAIDIPKKRQIQPEEWYNHGHPPGKLCSIEIDALMKVRQNLPENKSTLLSVKNNPEPKKYASL